MRTVICKQCKNPFGEDDFNPAVHYSNPSDICWRCEAYEKLPAGAYYQDETGQYKQKPY